MKRTLLVMFLAVPVLAHADALEEFCRSEYADAKRRDACIEFHRKAHGLFDELLANRERMDHAMEELRKMLAEELRRAEEALRKYREELERLQGEQGPHHSTEVMGTYTTAGVSLRMTRDGP
ncbi:MAG: hypothetical protein GWN84_05670 [Gammaproteobacteria bacterium]|nr:hypothetical protein [Gammaproteobacteria bacterium]NIR82466.1 hypothetical protein [Gammaproteobacteria bacterium]NIR88462.1 hypothetical protein [Gammaproteobacteria bacterium]NIU03602.1 hypothetical protein [Gammaproteobacteria bacterium]NIV50954.1 hypothetical protein [Gammaproteobacteria bacterium]